MNIVPKSLRYRLTIFFIKFKLKVCQTCLICSTKKMWSSLIASCSKRSRPAWTGKDIVSIFLLYHFVNFIFKNKKNIFSLIFLLFHCLPVCYSSLEFVLMSHKKNFLFETSFLLTKNIF